MTILASIWAQDASGVLGSGSQMLWRIPGDFAHFKELTMGCPIIMGRKSWQALGGGPLPGRTNIVITRSHLFEAPGAVLVYSPEKALAVAREEAERTGAPRMWITGGAQLYEQMMDHVDELVVTSLDLDVTAANPDQPVVRAPRIDEDVWRVDESRTDVDWREASGDARWRVTTYVRR